MRGLLGLLLLCMPALGPGYELVPDVVPFTLEDLRQLRSDYTDIEGRGPKQKECGLVYIVSVPFGDVATHQDAVSGVMDEIMTNVELGRALWNPHASEGVCAEGPPGAVLFVDPEIWSALPSESSDRLLSTFSWIVVLPPVARFHNFVPARKQKINFGDAAIKFKRVVAYTDMPYFNHTFILDSDATPCYPGWNQLFKQRLDEGGDLLQRMAPTRHGASKGNFKFPAPPGHEEDHEWFKYPERNSGHILFGQSDVAHSVFDQWALSFARQINEVSPDNKTYVFGDQVAYREALFLNRNDVMEVLVNTLCRHRPKEIIPESQRCDIWHEHDASMCVARAQKFLEDFEAPSPFSLRN